MIRFQDPFSRDTIVEVLPSKHNASVVMVVRKERQTIYESYEIECAEKLVENLTKAINEVKNG